MADITVSYKGSTIAEVSASGTTTLETAGKYCEDDITLQYVKPSGGGSYVGGTVAWNQFVQTNSASVTVPNAHKYLSRINGTNTIAISNGSAIFINDGTEDNVFDLTLMFGSTIADYVYTLESGTAGAGIAWLKANGFFNSAYYPYDAGTLKSVETFAHPFKDSNGKVIGYFPMNFDLELRGIPKLDANNVLYYDGDEYDGNGTVTRKYGIVDLGTLDWQKTSGKNNLFNTKLSLSTAAYGGANNAVCKAVCAKYVSASITNTYTNEADKTVSFTATGYCYIDDSAYTDAATFKTAMSGIYLVYELATPTTESV